MLRGSVHGKVEGLKVTVMRMRRKAKAGAGRGGYPRGLPNDEGMTNDDSPPTQEIRHSRFVISSGFLASDFVIFVSLRRLTRHCAGFIGPA
jgi:hypothetical protein